MPRTWISPPLKGGPRAKPELEICQVSGFLNLAERPTCVGCLKVGRSQYRPPHKSARGSGLTNLAPFSFSPGRRLDLVRRERVVLFRGHDGSLMIENPPAIG